MGVRLFEEVGVEGRANWWKGWSGMDYGVAWVGGVRARRETVLSNHLAVTAVGNVADNPSVFSQERNFVGNYECNDDMFPA